MTGDYHYLGWISRAQANTDARTLNLQFAKKTSVFDKIAGKASTSIRRLIALHLESFSPSLAESTRSNRSWEYQKLERELGDWDAASTTTMELSQYLKGLDSDGSRARYRTRLVELFDTAVCEGFCKTNPATSLRRVHSEVKRSRLTIEDFWAIHACAKPWLQNAMELALVTLQRRDDLVSLLWSADTGDALLVEQKKTGKRLKIEIGPDLREILSRCRDRVACQYILHRLPEKGRPKDMQAVRRMHTFQILPEQLTRAFAKAFAQSGLSVGEGRTRPTFHEIRSLGIAEYRKAGWSEQEVQALAGHADVEMTRHYMEGHEAPWQPVKSGLSTRRKGY